jgi:RluA family pseudouridine synthase
MTPVKTAYEDPRLVVVDKPAGQLVIPGRGPQEGPCLREAVEAVAGKRVFVVHRLDRDTSGLVVFAKDELAHRMLSKRFESREVRKTYLALVRGTPPDVFEADARIHRFGSGRMGADPRGKPARTRFKTIERFAGAALVEAEPLTGRQHQIRVHLYSLGHPVLGDSLYTLRPTGAPEPWSGKGAKPPRLMLHANRLAFRGPEGAEVDVRCDPPEDFRSMWEALRRGGKSRASGGKS